MDEKIVLCGANAYDKKYYFNQQFNKIPDSIKDELHIICVLFTEEEYIKGECRRTGKDKPCKLYPKKVYGTPLQCSCLENPRDGGASRAAVYGVAQSRTRLKRLSSSSSS